MGVCRRLFQIQVFAQKIYCDLRTIATWLNIRKNIEKIKKNPSIRILLSIGFLNLYNFLYFSLCLLFFPFLPLPLFIRVVSLPVGVEMRSNWDSFISDAMFTPRPNSFIQTFLTSCFSMKLCTVQFFILLCKHTNMSIDAIVFLLLYLY